MPAVRVNISVPSEVRQRMQAAPGVNWSAVATAAFRNKIDELPEGRDLRRQWRWVRRLLAGAVHA